MLRRNLKGAYTIWYRDVIRFSRDRPRIIAALAQPMLYLFVFGTGLGSAMSGSPAGAVDFRQFMFPGTLAMTVLFTAIFSAISIVWDREFGFLKEVMVAPVSRTAVATLTRLFELARFSHRALGPTERDRALDALDAIKAAIEEERADAVPS